MNGYTRAVSTHATRIVAVALICVFYFLARQPQISSGERARLVGEFAFRSVALPELSGGQQTIRNVSPSLRGIAGWVSATGAGVALNDLDGDGLPNDLCLVEPRTDAVIVSPVPSEAARYAPFALDASGLYRRETMAPMGCLPADFNEDGLTDLLVYYWGRTPLIFLNRSGAPTKAAPLSPDSYRAQEVVPGGEMWNTGAATLADLDGDGHQDLVIGNYFADGARVLDADSADPVSMQHSMTRAFNGGRSRILRWAGAKQGSEPAVRFEVVDDYVAGSAAERERVTRGWTLAIAAADLDNDLLPELYFANDFGPDRLLHNRSRPGELRFAPVEGVRRLTTPASKVLGRDGFKGMGVDFGDINGDGLLDLFVSNIADSYALEESHFAFINTGESGRLKEGVAPYVDESESLGLSRGGWAWEAKLGDFNNDGRPEVLQATGFMRGTVDCWPELHELAMTNDQLIEAPGAWPLFTRRCGLSDEGHNPFFVMSKGGRYYDIAKSLGLGHSSISRGIAEADVDGDGRLDFAVANQWEDSFFYHNESPRVGDFLGLHLRLPLDAGAQGVTRVYRGHLRPGAPSVSAIGAQVAVEMPGGKHLVAEVDGGNGHSGRRSPDLHFGLGRAGAGALLPVEIRWRGLDGRVNKLRLSLKPGWHTLVLGGAEWRSDDDE